jgi:hypothetical protein
MSLTSIAGGGGGGGGHSGGGGGHVGGVGGTCGRGSAGERRERRPGGLTREVERALPSNSPHDHMLLRVDLVGAHAGGGNALAFKQPTWPYDIESGPGGLTREVETPLPSISVKKAASSL